MSEELNIEVSFNEADARFLDYLMVQCDLATYAAAVIYAVRLASDYLDHPAGLAL